MANFLAALELEHWYQMVIAASFALLVISLVVPLQGVPNAAVQLLALAGMCIGTGEWINHPLQTSVDPHLRYKIWGYPRHATALGVSFDLAGALLFMLGVRLIVMR